MLEGITEFAVILVCYIGKCHSIYCYIKVVTATCEGFCSVCLDTILTDQR